MNLTDIANIALGLLGARRIDDFETDDTVEARACRLHLPLTLRALLRRHQWSCGHRTIPVTIPTNQEKANLTTGPVRWTATTPGAKGNDLTLITQDAATAFLTTVTAVNNVITVNRAGRANLADFPTPPPFNPNIPEGVPPYIEIRTAVDPAQVTLLAFVNMTTAQFSVSGPTPTAPCYSDLGTNRGGNDMTIGSGLLQGETALLVPGEDPFGGSPEVLWTLRIRRPAGTIIVMGKSSERTSISPIGTTWPTNADFTDPEVFEPNYASSTAAQVLAAAASIPTTATAQLIGEPTDTFPTVDPAQAFTGGSSGLFGNREFRHAYQLPADLVRLIRLSTGDQHNPIRSFAIQGRLLLTNTPEFDLHYITEDCLDDLDDLFIDALTLTLASKLAADVAADPQLKQSLLQQIEQLHLPAATSADAKETHSGENFGPRALASMSSLVQARFATRNSSIQRPTLP